MAEAQTAPPGQPRVEQPGLDPAPGGDPTSPPVVLLPVIERLQRLAEASTANPRRQSSLVLAARAAEGALAQYTDGSTDLDAVIAALGKASRNLQAIQPDDAHDGRLLSSLATDLVVLARSLAADVVELATAAGVDPRTLRAARAAMSQGDARLAAGNFSGAAKAFGEGLGLASGGVHFDLDTFEEKIREIGPNVVGYAYTIGVGGQLARSGAEGQARTDADAPVTDQSPDKEQFLASVSKTVTGVAMLRALQDQGLSVESPVAPFLPPSWALGEGADDLSFRDLFNHKSGFASGTGNTFAGLETRLAQPFPALPTSFAYSNANFGLMRILIPRMTAGAAFVNFFDSQTDDAAAPLYASFFQQYVQSKVLQPSGIDGQCNSNDGADETRYYNFPLDDQPGYDEPDRLLECGGYGWFLSSNELGALMANLRYTNKILKPDTRATMDKLFLGWLDPTRYGWSTGTFGTYQNHGGDWTHGPGQAHTCIMKFPINVEVSLVINSERNFSGHQCTVLRNAFDASWIA